jgi:hypothetical protein
VKYIWEIREYTDEKQMSCPNLLAVHRQPQYKLKNVIERTASATPIIGGP